MVLASSNPTAWPLSIGVTRLLWVHLTLRPTSSPYRGFVAKDCSPQRPVGYMANGSFHDELLSVHKTQMVSLTHRMTRIRGQIPASREPMADDQWLIMSDRCPVVRCVPERQAGPASEDSCSKIQVLNANASVLNALHPRNPRRRFTPCTRGRVLAVSVDLQAKEDHRFHGLKRIRGATFNEQRVPARRGTTGNGKFVLLVRRVYAMASWIGVWIWLMVPVTAALESQGSGP